MRIQNNIMALNTYRQYNATNSKVASSAEKLSSGYRINRAGDDAAGLAISEKMRAQIRGLNMASKNSLDAVSLVQTAEGALQETHNILQRMRELAVQSASDSNESKIDRKALDDEFQALKEEINDISSKTRFNDQNLIDGTFQKNTSHLVAPGSTATNKTIAAGYGKAISAINVTAADAGTYGISATQKAAVAASVSKGAAAAVGADTDMKGGWASTSNVIFSTVKAAAFKGVNTAAHNGNTYTISIADGSSVNSANFLLKDSAGNIVASSKNIDVSTWKGDDSGVGTTTNYTVDFAGVGSISFGINNVASGGTTLAVKDISELSSFVNGSTMTINAVGADTVSTAAEAAHVELSMNGETVKVFKGDTYANFRESGIVINFAKALSDADVAAFNTNFLAATGSQIVVGHEDGNALIVQAGANQGDELGISIDSMSCSRLGVQYSDITTQKTAADSITDVNNAINKVSTQRAALGALQNRLNHKIANLDNSAENLTAAESRIRDIDMAKEMTNFTKENIKVQAGIAMLAQANSQPQNVLQLLG